MIKLTLNTTQTKAAMRKLKDKAPIAIARALNRARTAARTVQVREMSRDMGISQSAIKKEVRETNATPTKLFCRIEVTGARIPLYQFKARQTKRGVSYKLPGGAGKIDSAFIATMRSGHMGVFKRKGARRLPIQELYGPSLPRVFEKVRPLGLARGEEALATNLQHEFKFAMQQVAAGA